MFRWSPKGKLPTGAQCLLLCFGTATVGSGSGVMVAGHMRNVRTTLNSGH